MKHIPDGESFFEPKHRMQHEDFGFSGSINEREHGGHPPFAGDKPTRGPKGFARGGHTGTEAATRENEHPPSAPEGKVPFAGHKPQRGPSHVPEPEEIGEGEPGDYNHGGHVHPHGGHVVHEEHKAGGGKICHMSHGGMTVHHADGHVTHHLHNGSEVMRPGTGPEGEYANTGGHMHPHGSEITRVEQTPDGGAIHHYSHGGHTKFHADGRMTHHVENGTPAHLAHGGIENHHDTESEYVHKARGGRMPSLPRSMKPMAERHRSPIGASGAHAPKDPMRTPTPRNDMPGGNMAYGVEPGSEPDAAGSEQGIPQLRRGGHAR